ncbi:MAG: hypothetical protein IKP45_05665 [Bacteroidales bacterium]|nr:hypothetical protein [Bacteroidales bacterium]
MNIVTLTSYGYRLQETAPKAIKSLYTNYFKPDKIILYVAHADSKYITNQFNEFKELEIRYVDDYLSHKKFYSLTDRTLDNDFIIIVDDDLDYKEYFWDKLWTKYNEHKADDDNFIVCNRAQLLSGNEYRKTPFIMKNDSDSGVFRFGSGSGLLIPPHTMRIDLDTFVKGFELVPHCDETFYSCYCAANDIRTYSTGKPNPFYLIPLPKKDPNGLWTKYNQFEKDSNLIKVKRYFNLIDDNIFVSFTSWKKRIHLASKVVENMRAQTLRPFKIILTLSSDEFTNKEKDLPKELLALRSTDFEIRWVKENTKTFKKLEPLFYVHPEHWVLIIDDDVKYPDNFIELMYSSVKNNQPVTGSSFKTDYRRYGVIMSANGAFTLIKPLHCLPYLKEIKDFALSKGFTTICSDPALTYATLLNGYTFTKSKKDFRPLQQAGEGKYPEPYSRGKEGYERNVETHKIITEYLEKRD